MSGITFRVECSSPSPSHTSSCPRPPSPPISGTIQLRINKDSTKITINFSSESKETFGLPTDLTLILLKNVSLLYLGNLDLLTDLNLISLKSCPSPPPLWPWSIYWFVLDLSPELSHPYIGDLDILPDFTVKVLGSCSSSHLGNSRQLIDLTLLDLTYIPLPHLGDLDLLTAPTWVTLTFVLSHIRDLDLLTAPSW